MFLHLPFSFAFLIKPSAQAMMPSINPLRYTCVAEGKKIIVEYPQVKEASELSAMASSYIENMPLFHRSFSHTCGGTRFICLIEGSFLYCAIFYEWISKARASSFLNQLMSEFMRCRWEGKGMAVGFLPVLDRLVSSMTEEANEGSFIAFLRKSRQEREMVKEQVQEVKDIMMGNNSKVIDKGQSFEIILDSASFEPVEEPERRNIYVMEHHHHQQQQLAHRMWRRNLLFFLLLNALVMFVLLVLWICMCRGISCIKS